MNKKRIRVRKKLVKIRNESEFSLKKDPSPKKVGALLLFKKEFIPH